MQSAPSVSTPQIRTPGFNDLIAVAKPPPADADHDVGHLRHIFQNFEPHRALPRHDEEIVERMNVRPSLALKLRHFGERRSSRGCEFYLRPIASRGLDVIARRRFRHQH